MANKLLPILTSRGFDLNINTRGQTQLIKRFDRLGRGLDDIDEPLVGSYFKLLTCLFINMGSRQHRVSLDTGRQRNRAMNYGASPLGRIYNVGCTLVQDRVIVRLHPNSNYFLRRGHVDSLTDYLDRSFKDPYSATTNSDESQILRPSAIYVNSSDRCRGKNNLTLSLERCVLWADMFLAIWAGIDRNDRPSFHRSRGDNGAVIATFSLS